jgi:hypothetical protein
LQPHRGPSHTAAFHELADSLGVRHGFLPHGHDSPLGFQDHPWNMHLMEPVVATPATLQADGGRRK